MRNRLQLVSMIASIIAAIRACLVVISLAIHHPHQQPDDPVRAPIASISPTDGSTLMSKLQLTPDQLATLAEVLKKLGEITAETGIEFDCYGSWDVQYAGNAIRVRLIDGVYQIDNYCA